jgi:hypothetical protein
VAHTPKYEEMTATSRKSEFFTLHSFLKDGVLEKGSLAQMAKMFSVDGSAMAKFWCKTNLKNCFAAKRLLMCVLTILSFFVNNKQRKSQ